MKLNIVLIMALFALPLYAIQFTDIQIGVAQSHINNTVIEILEPVFYNEIEVFSMTGMYLSTFITYPANTTVFERQCWVKVEYITNYSNAGGISLSSCRLYNWDGVYGHNYTLNKTLNGPFGNNSVNFSIDPSQIQFYKINCTASTYGGALTNDTQSTEVQLIGQSFCAGEPDAPAPAQTAGTVILIFMVLAFMMCVLLGHLTMLQTGYIVLILVMALCTFGYNTAEEIGQESIQPIFEIGFILSALGLGLSTLYMILNMLRDVLKLYTRRM